MKEYSNNMITPNEAYNIFKKNVKEKIVTNVVVDWGDIYTISNVIPGDFVTNDYSINKTTGEIKSLDFLDVMNIIQSHEDDPVDYTIK